MELLMKENERLKQELEGHAEKALRIQKVQSSFSLANNEFYTHITNKLIVTHGTLINRTRPVIGLLVSAHTRITNS